MRGDIVLANMPFTDMSGAKIRPALVVQCDDNNARLADVIVAMITRTTKFASNEPTQLLIDIATPDGKTTRFLHTSAVKCEHLITLHQNLFIKTIGQMPTGLMAKIDECLKAALELS